MSSDPFSSPLPETATFSSVDGSFIAQPFDLDDFPLPDDSAAFLNRFETPSKSVTMKSAHRADAAEFSFSSDPCSSSIGSSPSHATSISSPAMHHQAVVVSPSPESDAVEDDDMQQPTPSPVRKQRRSRLLHLRLGISYYLWKQVYEKQLAHRRLLQRLTKPAAPPVLHLDPFSLLNPAGVPCAIVRYTKITLLAPQKTATFNRWLKRAFGLRPPAPFITLPAEHGDFDVGEEMATGGGRHRLCIQSKVTRRALIGTHGILLSTAGMQTFPEQVAELEERLSLLPVSARVPLLVLVSEDSQHYLQWSKFKPHTLPQIDSIKLLELDFSFSYTSEKTEDLRKAVQWLLAEAQRLDRHAGVEIRPMSLERLCSELVDSSYKIAKMNMMFERPFQFSSSREFSLSRKDLRQLKLGNYVEAYNKSLRSFSARKDLFPKFFDWPPLEFTSQLDAAHLPQKGWNSGPFVHQFRAVCDEMCLPDCDVVDLSDLSEYLSTLSSSIDAAALLNNLVHLSRGWEAYHPELPIPWHLIFHSIVSTHVAAIAEQYPQLSSFHIVWPQEIAPILNPSTNMPVSLTLSKHRFPVAHRSAPKSTRPPPPRSPSPEDHLRKKHRSLIQTPLAELAKEIMSFNALVDSYIVN